MKYYVEINGNSSLDIQGLAIESLPNISKPLIRTTREEIDGRDGDIITKLGYSAYDKTLNIGLWGNYDINEVIAFFNEEGVITFSNEPDKYYKFHILNRIDFVNQLEKFRKASITIHCQPFKYQEQEAKVIEEESHTETGTSFTLTDTLEAPLLMDLKGNTQQTGTPTPSSPIPVNVVSGDNTITISNSDNTETTTYNIDLPVENLLDIDNLTFKNGYYNNSGTYHVANTIGMVEFIDVKPNTTYTISVNTTLATIVSVEFNGSSFIRRNIQGITKVNTFTTGSTTNKLAIFFQLDNSTTMTREIIASYQPQLEKGPKANTYTPYGTTPIELNKIGTYQDYIYKENDKWYLHKEVGKKIWDNTQYWYNYANPDGMMRYYTPDGDFPAKANLGCSTHFVLGDYDDRNKAGQVNKFFIGGNNVFQIVSDILNTNDFKDMLEAKKPVVYYALSSATNTEITYTPLIEQLNALEEAQSYEGTTNINQVNNDLPFILDITYYTGDTSITITNDGNIYSKPLLELKGTGNINIYLNGIQVFVVSLNDEIIYIDTDKMEAYYQGTLKNRQVIGDYNNFNLQSGDNTIQVDGGYVEYLKITNYSRWV